MQPILASGISSWHCWLARAEAEIFLQWSTNYAIWHNRLWPQGRHLIHASTGTQALGFLDVPGRWAIVPWSLYESLG